MDLLEICLQIYIIEVINWRDFSESFSTNSSGCRMRDQGHLGQISSLVPKATVIASLGTHVLCIERSEKVVLSTSADLGCT